MNGIIQRDKMYKIRVSERTLKQLRDVQANSQSTLGIKLSFDKVILLSLDKKIVILKINESKSDGEKEKPKRLFTVFREPLSDMNGRF